MGIGLSVYSLTLDELAGLIREWNIAHGTEKRAPVPMSEERLRELKIEGFNNG